MSAKPCPAYAIRVRHNEVRSGAGGIRSAHLTAFCSPRQRRLCSSVPFGGSCLSSAHPTTECGFESQRVKRQALCSLARPSGIKVGVSVPVSVNSYRRHTDGEHDAAPVCGSACGHGRRCLSLDSDAGLPEQHITDEGPTLAGLPCQVRGAALSGKLLRGKHCSAYAVAFLVSGPCLASAIGVRPRLLRATYTEAQRACPQWYLARPCRGGRFPEGQRWLHDPSAR